MGGIPIFPKEMDPVPACITGVTQGKRVNTPKLLKKFIVSRDLGAITLGNLNDAHPPATEEKTDGLRFPL
ncbi:hypothetical protein Y032_0035g3060 [Ancylostoma ceylanicum]|uniref:Uncharacterized protein n=1 Tax=Ancylostoma ceylanicum TaxID=53326 RepID=A0A016UKN8_9BILA|nr:hypothetical protein Y032_0035g3060 [Ancylostoma ceylanicum]